MQEKIRVNLHVLGGFRYNISGPLAGSCTHFHGQNLRSIRRGLLEWVYEFLSDFIEASKKFKFKYHNSKLFKNFENYSAHTESTDLILSFFKKYLSSVTIPLDRVGTRCNHAVVNYSWHFFLNLSFKTQKWPLILPPFRRVMAICSWCQTPKGEEKRCFGWRSFYIEED